jgi:hypothetical protein
VVSGGRYVSSFLAEKLAFEIGADSNKLPMLLENCPWLHSSGRQAAIAKAANLETCICERGVPSNQAATRFRLIATAVKTCCRWVFSMPLYRHLRRPQTCVP